jgi:predicted lysophospholipase L1 biosynthesis ABC-type transport system permease subunit
VVGRTVIPPSGQTTASGEGVLLTLDGLAALAPPGAPPEFTQATDVLVRFAAGASHDRVFASLQPLLSPNEPLGEIRPETPADIVNFGQVQNLPLVLGAVLAVVAAATLGHAVGSSVRRRRLDLAILKTLGFVRRQVRVAVAWQSSLIVLVGLAVGIPIGIAAGRWGWNLFADQAGMVPRARVPALAMALVVPAALLIANVIAAVPGRAAARLRPALVLRAE